MNARETARMGETPSSAPTGGGGDSAALNARPSPSKCSSLWAVLPAGFRFWLGRTVASSR